ncbi:IQ domain-containing protein E isoform 2-T2 [Megaptera novaeangliae]
MSLSTGEPASETGDDSLSAITFDSDSETKAKRKSFHKPPPTSPKSPYQSKPRKVASWRSLRTAGTVPLGSRMSLTPQKLWLGSSKQGYVPGTPVYREKEDMYDEIIELKKSLHMQKSNVDLMRTKLRRLEEENSRKDRQIEQLLDPSRGPDFVRTLAEKRPDTGWVVSGLKQRILKLEQRCKEKDHTIDKLQTDMKTTNLEEMRIAMETYYEEIHRLQTLLASSEPTGKKPPAEKKIGLKRQKKMSSALLSLSRSVQELTEENQSLKEDLDRVLSSSPTASKIKGSVEWSKPRLLRRIAELEKKISLMESPKSHASEVVGSTPPAHSASSPTVHRQPRPDRQEESERLRGVVKRLKGERSALHTQLQERDLEVKQLLQTKADLEKELENMKEGEKEGREREEALREEIQALTRKFQELEESKKGEEENPEEMSPETRKAPRPPRPSQTDSELDTSEGGSSRPRSGCSEGRRDAAARLLQRRWKGHQHRDSPEPRVPSPVVQAEGDPWQEEPVTIIQSAFRAHLARARHSAAGPRAATAALPDRPAWAPQSAACSPPFPADSPGRQRGEQRGDRGGSGSRGRSAEAMGARGAGSPAALLCGALSLGAAARGDSARGGRELTRLRRDRRGSASAHEEHRLPALGPCGCLARGDALSGQGQVQRTEALRPERNLPCEDENGTYLTPHLRPRFFSFVLPVCLFVEGTPNASILSPGRGRLRSAPPAAGRPAVVFMPDRHTCPGWGAAGGPAETRPSSRGTSGHLRPCRRGLRHRR